jgi:exodeoxyribonuclease VII small subunit
MKYEEALKQLEQIVGQLENGELGIEELTVKLKKAKELLQSCKEKLTQTDEEVKKILADDK